MPHIHPLPVASGPSPQPPTTTWWEGGGRNAAAGMARQVTAVPSSFHTQGTTLPSATRYPSIACALPAWDLPPPPSPPCGHHTCPTCTCHPACPPSAITTTPSRFLGHIGFTTMLFALTACLLILLLKSHKILNRTFCCTWHLY